MPTNFGILRGASSLISVTLSALPSDASLLSGWESSAVDSTVNISGTSVPPEDEIIGGVIFTGTSPTAGTQIEVWLGGCFDDSLARPAGLTGTDAALAIASANVKQCLRNVATITVDNVTGRRYSFGPVSVASFFNYVLPRSWSLFFVHNTGVNLKSTGNVIYRTPVARQGA